MCQAKFTLSKSIKAVYALIIVNEDTINRDMMF